MDEAVSASPDVSPGVVLDDEQLLRALFNIAIVEGPGMDAQTIAIIGVGATLIAVFMPPMIMLIHRVDDLNNQVSQLAQVVTALANHSHDADDEATLTLPAD
ncbi:MAG: hypothetical protein OXL37_10675 [Chloroflexota bacterium]|nr:hypothetical protein [Chloroflexota bacterium]MDE2960614.1 hypothetical protein [Chloroflexota bacterium]